MDTTTVIEAMERMTKVLEEIRDRLPPARPGAVVTVDGHLDGTALAKVREVFREHFTGPRPGEWVTPQHLADMVRAAVDEPPAGGE